MDDEPQCRVEDLNLRGPEGRLIYSQVRSAAPPTRHLVGTSGRIRAAGRSSMGGVLYRLSYAGVE